LKILATVWNLITIDRERLEYYIRQGNEFWPVLYAKDPIAAFDSIKLLDIKRNAVIPLTSLNSAKETLTSLSSRGVKICMYDLEHWAETPSKEQFDPLNSCRTMSELTTKIGMKLYLAPDYDFTKGIAAKVAVFAHGYIIQSERLQSNASAFSDFVLSAREAILKANDLCDILCEVALDDHPDSIRRAVFAWGKVAKFLDGLYVANPTGKAEILQSFLQETLRHS
jgi:hypothetical protein